MVWDLSFTFLYLKFFISQGMLGTDGMMGMDDMLAETEEVLSEFDFLGPDSGEGAGEARSQDGSEWGE